MDEVKARGKAKVYVGQILSQRLDYESINNSDLVHLALTDHAALAELVKRQEKRRHDLGFALRSRIITPEEMGRVAEYGDSLYMEHRGFAPGDAERQALNDALLQQFKMQGMKS